MAKKRLHLDKQVHFPPFKYGDRCYDLSHLDAHKVEFIHNNDPKKTPISYTFYVSYSFHCFAKDFSSLDDTQRHALMYHTQKESRPFCFRRYHLSKSLPDIMSHLDTSKLVFHGGYESYATCTVEDEKGDKLEYFVSFEAYRWQKKLRLHVKSAYPLDQPLGKVKKVNIFAIARALLQNKPLPKPQK